jgi:hypothetical protein
VVWLTDPTDPIYAHSLITLLNATEKVPVDLSNAQKLYQIPLSPDCVQIASCTDMAHLPYAIEQSREQMLHLRKTFGIGRKQSVRGDCLPDYDIFVVGAGIAVLLC